VKRVFAVNNLLRLIYPLIGFEVFASLIRIKKCISSSEFDKKVECSNV